MTQVKDEIFARMDELSPAEKKVARALLSDYPGAGLASANALAKSAGTSTPTVLRLVTRLELGSYPDLQRRLRDEVSESMNSPVARARSHLDTGEHSQLQRSLALRHALIESVAATVPPTEMDRFVAALTRRPRSVVISGGYFSRHIARIFASQLDQLIPGVAFADEPLGNDVGKYLELGKDGVVIVFDFRRYERVAQEVSAMAKARGAAVLLITDTGLSPSADDADVVLPVSVDGVPFDSFAAVLALTECLIDAAFDALGQSGLERMTQWERSTGVIRANRNRGAEETHDIP